MLYWLCVGPFWIRKTYQKPVQNNVWTLQKLMSKTCRFSILIFSGFGLDFGASWASSLEPSWPFWPPKLAVSAYVYVLKLTVLYKWCLGGLRTRFRRPWASILEGSGNDFSKFSTAFGFVSSTWLLHRHSAEKAKVWPKSSQNVRISLPHVPSALQSCRCKP